MNKLMNELDEINEEVWKKGRMKDKLKEQWTKE